LQALFQAAIRLSKRRDELRPRGLRRRVTQVEQHLDHRIFAPLALSLEPERQDIEQLNKVRSRTLARSRIDWSPGGFRIAWHSDPSTLEDLLIPIILSATDLLTSDHLQKLRQCAGDTCEWLFLDTSRNHLRRWCSMDDCGKRAKSRRQYARVRQMRHARS
jgi:predicted RNA-binding Zn ribbon-like protein